MNLREGRVADRLRLGADLGFRSETSCYEFNLNVRIGDRVPPILNDGS